MIVVEIVDTTVALEEMEEDIEMKNFIIQCLNENLIIMEMHILAECAIIEMYILEK